MATTPDYQNKLYGEIFPPLWKQVNAVLGGTYTLRQAADEYLPQYPAEADESYRDRVDTATSDADYADTLDGILGMIFRRPPQIGENVPARIRAFLENIDLRGTHFNVFAQRFGRKGVHLGAAYIVVDMQRRPAELDGQTLDDAQVAELGLRPYWIAYGANDVQNSPRFLVINGALTLQQIVFRETATLPDGEFGEEEITRYRVWRLLVEPLSDGTYRKTGGVEWQVWEERAVAKSNERKLEQTDGGVLNLPELPVAEFVANPDPYNSRELLAPTLLDLSYLCIKHWQQQSDHESNLHLCSSPIPYTVNLRDDGALTEQPWGKGVRYDCNEGGSVGYAEPTGSGLEAMERQLASVKEAIRQKGLEMVLEGGAPNTTATEQILRARKRASRLSQMTLALQDCFERALQLTAMWLGLGGESGGEITMGVKGDELILTAQDVTAYSQLAEKNQMPLRELWSLLQRGGILRDDFDADTAEAELQAVKREASAIAQRAALTTSQITQATA